MLLTNSRGALPRIFTFLLCLAVLVARTWARFIHPDIWAEDGPVYLCEALVQGWGSIFSPFAGSYYVIQRGLAVLITQLTPVAQWPLWIGVTHCLILAGVASRWASERYAWLVPQLRLRVAIAFLLLFTPGLNEMLGSLANATWVLYFAFVFILLQDPKDPLSPLDLVLSLLVIWSTGTAILMLPLIAWRVWLALRSQDRQRIRGELILCLEVVTALIWLMLHKERIPVDWAPILQSGVVVLIEHAARSLIFQPWLGDFPTRDFSNGYPAVYWFVGALLLVSTFFWAWRRRKEQAIQALVCCTLGVLAWPFLCWLGRPGAIASFIQPVHKGFWSFRYAFPIGAMGIAFWISMMAPHRKKWLWYPCTLFIVAYVASGLYRFRTTPFGEESNWNKDYPKLESALKGEIREPVSIRQQPIHWTLPYQFNNPGFSCLTDQTRR